MNQLANIADVQLPAHIQGDSADAAALVTSESVPRISLKDASFRLKKDGNEINVGLAKPIQVVILGIDPPEAKRCGKQYYEGAWTDDSADAPDCYSKDGVRPDASIAEPQCDTCAQCPMNAWGSGHDADGNPSKGKACSDRKNLLVVLAGKHIDGDVFQLSVPPTSLKALSTYGRELVRYNVNMHKIVTQIDVDPDNSKAMVFGYAGFLDEQAANRMAARAASPELQEMVHPTALPAPAIAGASLDQPAEAVVDDELDLDALNAGSEETAPAQSQRAAPATKSATATAVKNPPPATEEVPLDSQGCQWDARIHSANKSVLGDGQWRLKRGVAAAVVEQVMAEIHPQPEGGGTESVGTDTGEITSQEGTGDDAADLDNLLDTWGDGV